MLHCLLKSFGHSSIFTGFHRSCNKRLLLFDTILHLFTLLSQLYIYTQQPLFLAHLRFAHMHEELSNYCFLTFQQLTSQGHLFHRYRLLQLHAMNDWCSVHLTLPLHWYHSHSSLIVSFILTREANRPMFVTFFNGCRIFSSL